MMRASFAIVVAVWFAGCAPFTVTKGRVAYPDQGFEVDLPPGWTTLAYLPPRLTRLPYAALESEKLFLTRDGLELQGISISRSAIGGGPDATRTTIAGRMSPQQAGAMEVDHLRARPGLRDLDLLEHTPATVAGKPGFRLVFHV